MPRPGDWNAIGLSSDPTPGDPDTISQLTDILQHLGGKAREIYAAIEVVMNSADDSVFSGQTADALRSKVDQRLRGHVEDVAWAFESAAGALRDWHSVVIEQQSRADAALNAGRGLAEDDPERQRQADIATQAGEYQAEQGRSVAGRIQSVSHIALPISACEIFWDAFKWLAIILIIPALVFGGPIALIALGVNLTLFIKTVVDFANGDASFLDLFLAGLGLIAPTTKGLPIFNIIKSVGSAVVKVGRAFFQGFKQLFTRDFLFTRLLPGLARLPFLASVAIRETGLFVLTGLRNVAGFTGGIFRAGGPLSLTGITRLPGVIAALPGRVWQGTKIWWRAGAPGRQAFRESVAFHFGGTKFLRIILPVDAGEIRAFGFWKALRIGLFDRGVLGQYRFGAPLVGGIGHTISAVPVNPGSAVGDGLTGLSHVSAPPPVDLSALRISNDFGSVTSSGFHAAKQLDSLDGIRLTDIVNVRTGDLGISVSGTTSVTSSGLHVPSTAGTTASGLHIPATSGISGTAIGSDLAGLPGSAHLPGAAVLPAATHVPGTNVLGVGFNVAPGNGVTNIAAAHLPPPAAGSIGDLIAPAVRNATPTVSPGLGTNIGEGTTHGLIANQVRLGLDDLVNLPNTHLQNNAVVQPPTVDRIGAAMQLVDHKPANVTTPNVFHSNDAARAGSANGAPLHTAPHQPVNVPVKPVNLPGQAVDVPLKGLPDRPGAYLRIEEHGGGRATYQLFDGGPHGRMDVLPGEYVRFTDDATGQTFRFDDTGTLMDKGVRLTKGDGVLRMDDRIVVHRPDGSFRVTTLAGDAVPEQLTVRPLEGGGVQVAGKEGVSWNYGQNGRLQGQSVGASWDSDLAARAGVFRKPGDAEDLVATRMDDFTDVQRAQQNFDVAKTDVDLHGGRGDGTSHGPSVGDQVNLNLHGTEQDLGAAKLAFETEHGLQVDRVQQQLDDLLANSIRDRPRAAGGGIWSSKPAAEAPVEFRIQELAGDVRVAIDNAGIELVNPNPGTTLDSLSDGGFRITEGSRSFRYDFDGGLVDSRFGLAGSTDRFVVRNADGLTLEGAVAGYNVRALDDGGFRVFSTDGIAQRYAADGVHLGDGRSLVDSNNLRGNLFVETDAASGTRLVDLQGQPVPGRVIDDLGNNRFFIRSNDGDIRWYGDRGSVEGTGIQVADPVHQGEVFLFRADGGQPRLVNRAGDDLAGTVEMLPGNGFRVTETNGVARTFDQAGLYVDRRVPLPDPAGGEQRLLVHDSNDVLTVYSRNGAQLDHTAQRLTDDSYRVTAGDTYQVYDSVGTHQARGYAARLPGENGFLHYDANGIQWLDHAYSPMPGRTATSDAAGNVTVTRPGGHDVFGPQGQLLHEVTDIRPNALDGALTRVTRDRNNGTVHWTAADGTPMTTPHVATMSPAGVTRLEINLPNGLRHGEYHEFSRTGQLVEQGFPVVRSGRATDFTYVVNHLDGTWRRVGDDATGSFLTGKIDVTGAGNGRIKLLSSSGKPVEVFERRWLTDGTILDSFRRTDTLGFGRFDRSATWVTYSQDGTSTGWGLRRFDTTGSGWQDVDGFRTIREYRDGLQKYGSSNGHVLAVRNGDNWHWYKYDGQGGQVADGVRVREALGDGWTDTFTRNVNNAPVTEVAQQKWGMWHGPSTAGQYREFTLVRGPNDVVDRPGTWEQLSRQGRDSGSGTALSDGVLHVVRRGEQRPPVWIRENPLFGDQRPTGIASHLGADSRFQIFDWSHPSTGGQGTRYVGADASLVDVDGNGAFVRSTGKLSDGTTLKVGDHAARPDLVHPQAGAIPWEAGQQRGWRVVNGNNYQDVMDVNGQWVVVREGLPGGLVREFPEPQNRNIWVQRDAHGNLNGMSSRALGGGPERYVVANGAVDSSNWRWFEVDGTGTRIANSGGDRQYFRGSTDEALSWDDSFRDFDAGGNLVRDRRMLDGGRYVESWQTGAQWRSVEFDKFGRQIAGSGLTRLWSTGDGWQTGWTRGADYFADVRPAAADGVQQTVRETPLHVRNSPQRVREYHQNAGQSDYAQWKEFDHGAVVRDRKLSGQNYLETDGWRNQWKLYDQHGNVIGERGHDGLVFELRDGRLRLTGSEYDFRGSLTEMRGWGRRLREAQRMPWLRDGDWTLGSGSTIVPQGNAALREAAYAPYLKSVLQKAMIEFGQDFLLEFTANLIVNAIIADVQGRSFTGKDALRALMNAGVSSTIKTGLGTAINDTKFGGPLRTFRQGQVNVDAGKHWNRRPLNHDRLWTNEWTGNEAATRWRGGTFDFGLNFVPSVLGGFVNGTMNAAIFGVSNADGTSVKLTGRDAVTDGGINALATLTTGAGTALVKTVATGFGGGRFFHRQGFGDFWLQIPFRMFEKTIQGLYLTSNYRASINPGYYRSTEPIGGPSLLALPPGVEIPPPVPHASGLVLPAGTGGTP